MQMRNTDIASNADIGVIHRIKRVADSEKQWRMGHRKLRSSSPVMESSIPTRRSWRLDLGFWRTAQLSI